MGRTSQLRAQHQIAHALAREILADGQHYQTRDEARSLTLKIARLAGVLRIHFALEDELLYPALRRQPDRDAALHADLVWQQVGDLAERFEAFFGEWSRADALLARPDAFRRDARALFSDLAARMIREEHEVFPMAERLEADRAAA